MLDDYDIAVELLGFPGRMLSGSKSAPSEKRVVWNSNVILATNGRKVITNKVWHGDISLADSADKLQELANRTGKMVFVLYEMDARFDNETKPLLQEAVEVFKPQKALR